MSDQLEDKKYVYVVGWYSKTQRVILATCESLELAQRMQRSLSYKWAPNVYYRDYSFVQHVEYFDKNSNPSTVESEAISDTEIL